MRISLYKAGLHKIVGVPRRWTVPKPSIEISIFRKALEKRSETLRSISQDFYSTTEHLCPSGDASSSVRSQTLNAAGELLKLEDKKQGEETSSKKRKRIQTKGSDESVPSKQLCVGKKQTAAIVEGQQQQQTQQQQQPQQQQQQQQQQANDSAGKTTSSAHHHHHNETPLLSEEESKRREELEEKLKSLTSEKHRLVQLLKQILSNEEDSKKRMLQSPPPPPPLPPPPPPPPPPLLPLPPLLSPAPSRIMYSETLSVYPLAPPLLPSPLPLPLPSPAPDIIVPMDLEEGELDHGRTPSPQSQRMSGSQPRSWSPFADTGRHRSSGFHAATPLASSNGNTGNTTTGVSGGGYTRPHNTHTHTHTTHTSSRGGRIVKWEK